MKRKVFKMILRYFYDKKLAQASYMVGCSATGEALIVDPMRDITPYLEAAQAEGLQITHVTETHIHADFVSGSRELAARTGAKLYLSAMGDANWQYGYDDGNVTLVREGDSWMVGNIKIEVLHTPGHTPEHIVFLVTDTAGADKPMGIFSGDFIFVGDVGRPDLLEEAAGYIGTKEIGARQQFQSIQRIKQLPDYLQIWPAHGAGSACGKALGAIPSTTLGYEKLFNPAFQYADEDSFVSWLLDGQPEAPWYFAQMKKVNKLGPTLLKNLPDIHHLGRKELDTALADGSLVVDFRSADAYAEKHILGTINVPATSDGFSTYVGWWVDFERPFYFITATLEESKRIINGLRDVGVDQILGFFTAEVVMGDVQSLKRINAAQLAELHKTNGMMTLDVRNKNEYQDVHIIGAHHIPLGYLPERLAELPQDRLIVVYCASGYRSQVAESLLRKEGFTNVLNLNDTTQAWSAFLPTERGK
jgi:hydroxyacylglutathione hydrolase